MLLPRFSIRLILLIMAGCAVYFVLLGMGIRGTYWAAGIAAAISTVIVLMLFHGLAFGLCDLISNTLAQPNQGERPYDEQAADSATEIDEGGESA